MAAENGQLSIDEIELERLSRGGQLFAQSTRVAVDASPRSDVKLLPDTQ
jgi:hypothetical protein